MVSPFFGPEIGENQKKKRLRRKINVFLMQMRLETKQNEKKKVFSTNQWSYGFTT